MKSLIPFIAIGGGVLRLAQNQSFRQIIRLIRPQWYIMIKHIFILPMMRIILLGLR